MQRKVKKKIAKAEPVQNLIDINGIAGLKAIPIITRKFVQYDIDFMNTQDIQLPNIDVDEVKDAIVKVNIRIRQTDLHKIDIKGFETLLKGECFYLKPIVPIIHKEHRVRSNKLKADQTPLDAVKAWLINRHVKDPDKIFEAAEKIIRGEELEA